MRIHLYLPVFGMVLSALLTTPADATLGFITDFVEVEANGSKTWYNIGTAAEGSIQAFQGQSLGTFDTSLDTLTFSDAQINTFKNGAGNVTNADLYYNVHLASDPQGTFIQRGLSFGSNAPITDVAGNNFNTGGDQRWQGISSADLLSGLSNGDYVVEVFARITGTDGAGSFDTFDSNGGSNFVASFTVAAVPEPSAFLFGWLVCSLLGVNFIRKHRTNARAN